METIKKYWLLILGAVGAILAFVFTRKSGPDAATLERAQSAELKVVDTKIDNIEAQKAAVEKSEPPKVSDADATKVNDYWKDTLK